MVLNSPQWHFSPKFGGAIELEIVDPSYAGRLHGQERSFESSFDDLDIDKQLKKPSLLDELHCWWESKISMILPQGADIRDHFALERTFLGHMRTALALAECSVLISQFFTLSLGSDDPMALEEVRFRQIGRPLSCALLIWAMIITVIGAFRFLRMQEALVREEPIIESGWELHIEGIGISIIVCFMFVATLAAES